MSDTAVRGPIPAAKWGRDSVPVGPVRRAASGAILVVAIGLASCTPLPAGTARAGRAVAADPAGGAPAPGAAGPGEPASPPLAARSTSAAPRDDLETALASAAAAREAATRLPAPTPNAPTTTSPGRPPADDADRQRRVRGSLAPGREIAEMAAVGDGSRWAMALVGTGDEKQAPRLNLVLIDVSAHPGVIVGEHDFGPAGPDSGGSGEEASGGRTGLHLAGTLESASNAGEPVVLADVASDATGSVACGWWLRGRGATFVCAPRVGVDSRYTTAAGVLVESWDADLPALARSGERINPQSGRALELRQGRWREVDHFACLGWPLGDALAEAGREGLATWQRRMARRLTASALRESARFETDVAIARLREALAIDGCNPDAWRRLGRLEYESGRAANAVPALAVALAFRPREEAALVDLADALAVLDTRPAAGAESLREALAVLESRQLTRPIVDDARRGRGREPGARELAIALYETYLARVRATAVPGAEAARRHAEEQLALLSPRRGHR